MAPLGFSCLPGIKALQRRRAAGIVRGNSDPKKKKGPERMAPARRYGGSPREEERAAAGNRKPREEEGLLNSAARGRWRVEPCRWGIDTPMLRMHNSRRPQCCHAASAYVHGMRWPSRLSPGLAGSLAGGKSWGGDRIFESPARDRAWIRHFRGMQRDCGRKTTRIHGNSWLRRNREDMINIL